MEWLSSALTPQFIAAMAGVAIVTAFNVLNPKPATGKGLHTVTKVSLGIFVLLLLSALGFWFGL
jgi:hypothetical protein